MKFAICNETFKDWPFNEAFAFAADCGYTGLEIAPFTINPDVRKISPQKRSGVRQQARRAGLEIVGLHWLLAQTEGLHLTSPDADVRRKTAEYLKELARFCADLGGKVMPFGSPQQRFLLSGISREQAMKYAAGTFNLVLSVLEDTGVVIGLEPLTTQEDHGIGGKGTPGFMNTAAQGMELVKMIGSSQVQLHLDCKAMAGEELESDPIPDVIRANAQHMVHFHANDPNLQGPGFGELNFRPIVKTLLEVGYRGWVSVEVFDYKPGPERLAKESIEYLQRCLAQVT